MTVEDKTETIVGFPVTAPDLIEFLVFFPEEIEPIIERVATVWVR